MESMNLKYVKPIVDCPYTNLHLHEHHNGLLVLSAALEEPIGTAFFPTSHELITLFQKGLICIQQLFDHAPSNQISIYVNNNTRIFLCGEVNVKLKNGERFHHDF